MGPPHSFIALLPALAFVLLLLFAPSAHGAITNTTFDDTSSNYRHQHHRHHQHHQHHQHYQHHHGPANLITIHLYLLFLLHRRHEWLCIPVTVRLLDFPNRRCQSVIIYLGTAPSPSADTPSSGIIGGGATGPQSAASGQHANIGAIVGAVLAVLALAILALIVFFLCRRRAQRRRAREDEERRAAGLPPAPRSMRRIRGNNVLQPFVDDRPPDVPAGSVLAGNVFAAGAFATASSGAGARVGTGSGSSAPASDTRAVAAGTSASASGFGAPAGTGTAFAAELPPAFVDTAATAGRFPADSKTRTPPCQSMSLPTDDVVRTAVLVDTAYTNAHAQPGHPRVARQPSQSTHSDLSRADSMMSPSEKLPRDRDRETVVSPSDLLSPSATAYTSERERYLEHRLATLEAHVASYLPPPYEQPEEL
ncbi:hypothetical protein B0H17DRAFT_1202443 [Mycena rosella]|uniref:Uncharacterized protein n=1 Tax=Mycena rosella TaxID=1033263 RepID=A0AAD7DEL1_MYCRO|nr:hypothetical protein B0H17DRAFT_1202443 [Mycena rosella]